MCDSPSMRMLGSFTLYTCISGGPIRMACNGGGGDGDDSNDDPRTKYEEDENDDDTGFGRPRSTFVVANRSGFGGEIGCESPVFRLRNGGVLGGGG